ncbi:MAG: hypothetical protein DRP96_01730 [Candidatus Neomarinimicrobiota bacterium]|nr:MAG: hypothetical protein DRP96_01730 [Candidatus Neomarinimicrobiota bacterium]
MNLCEKSEHILDSLIKAVKNAAINTFDANKSLFELTKTGEYPEQIVELAESFGMMIVKIEARELQLEQTLTELQNLHKKLLRELQKKQDVATELQKERNRLEDLVRQRRKELIKSNHKLQIEILSRKRIEEEREKLIFELTSALTRIKQLKRLLPICPLCKNIRDDKGYWNNLETYLQKHSNTEFSYGICRKCMKELYPDRYARLYGKIDH